MKKSIITVGIILALIIVALTIEHYYGDNIYGAFAFRNEDVIKISDSKYRTHKDKPECFNEYMKKQGWTFVDQMGSCITFENDTQKVDCFLDFKEFYAEYNVTYRSKNHDIEFLKENYPEYFFTEDATKGIEIYVWQNSEDNYQCVALLGTNRNKTEKEILDLFEKSVSIEEMNEIISYCSIKKDDVNIIPYNHPLSSYYCEIDDKYIKNVESMFVFE